MKKYILKRFLTLVPTIFIVSVVVFLLVHLTPGDPAAMMLGDDATMEDIAALHAKLGLDDPWLVQYVRWIGRCLHGDFGTSTAVSWLRETGERSPTLSPPCSPFWAFPCRAS